jgi:hypothetical protein
MRKPSKLYEKKPTHDDTWLELFGNILPMVSRIAARTVGLDLVSVQPLDFPIGNLQYVNFNYDHNYDHNYDYNNFSFFKIKVIFK